MLVIRREQMEVLAAALRKTYPDRFLGHLTHKLPSLAAELGRDALMGRIADCVERASGHGFEAEWDLCRFCYLDLLHGPLFDTRCHWAARILGMEEYSPADKIDRLESYHLSYLKSRSPRDG